MTAITRGKIKNHFHFQQQKTLAFPSPEYIFTQLPSPFQEDIFKTYLHWGRMG
jgi:hypothetical protein